MSINKKCALMFGVAPVALLLLAAGCNKGADSSAPPAPPGGPVAGPAPAASGQASTGKDLLTANCRCHNGGGGRAPDLSHEGASSDHTSQWIADHIKNPKTHNPNSRMPAFEGRMADADIQKIADYLAGLK